jgi:hypothetical protein
MGYHAMSDSEAAAFLRSPTRPAIVSTVRADGRPPFSYVMIEATASFSDDLDDVRVWAARIGGRYMGADNAAAYGERNGVPGERVVRAVPRKVIAIKDVAD